MTRRNNRTIIAVIAVLPKMEKKIEALMQIRKKITDKKTTYLCLTVF